MTYLESSPALLNFTPYYRWRHEHAIHHATAGDLDRRGIGDVYTMTVKEYLEAPWWKKFGYRVMRNPLALFLIGPLLVFVDRRADSARQRQTRNRQCLVDQCGFGRIGRIAHLADRLENLSACAIAGLDDCHLGWGLVVLRSA